jgi:transcriptional regulator with XRE-family HTH domain
MAKTQRDNLGTVLRQARLQAGLSTRELAKRAGLSHVAIMHFEKGTRTPTASTLMLLSFLLPLAGPSILGAFFLTPAIVAASATARSRMVIQGLIAQALKKHGAKVRIQSEGDLLVELPRFGTARVKITTQ